MRLSKLWMAALAVAVLFAGGRARADTYQVDYRVDPSAGLGMTFTRASGAKIHDWWAGARNATWHVNTPKPPNMPNSFSTFCVDLDHINISPTTVTLQPVGPGVPGSDLKMQRVAWLYNTHLSDVFAATGEDRKIKGAALQAAIWATVDGSSSVTDRSPGHFFVSKVGNHQLTSQVTSLADQWLLNLAGNVDTAVLLKADRSIPGNDGQDMIGPPPSSVPEPPSIVLLLACGLGAVGLLRVRTPKCRGATET